MSGAAELLGPDGPFAAVAGYEHREAQLAMARAVEHALEGGRVLLCEAGTGTGKTLGYLVPAIRSGQRIVISTATRALQEQIFRKDIPEVRRALAWDGRAALMKGLSNYVCLRRFTEARLHGSRPSLPMVERWVRETEVGDIAELGAVPEDDPVWDDVTSGSETRIGGACELYDACFVTRMKAEARDADLVVVNHHLFFADLALRATADYARAGILPPYDAVIFDEAHAIEDVATEFFGVRISTSKIGALLRDATRAFATSKVPAADATRKLSSVSSRSGALFAEIDRVGRAEEGRVPLPREAITSAMQDAYFALDDGLSALEDFAEANATRDSVDVIRRRAKKLRDDLGKVFDPRAGSIVFVEARARSTSIGASPVDVADLLRSQVFERVGSAVLTSATLVTKAKGEGSPFAYVRARLGLVPPISTPVDELALDSPFDFASQALFYQPEDLPDVQDGAFFAEAADRALSLVRASAGGAFVLTTSVRAMNAFAKHFRKSKVGDLLVQGEAPKPELIRRFAEHGDAVLVGTLSFWEGVDVRGRALRLVVLDKLPFAAPTDALFQARARLAEAEGQNPFLSLAVPEAALTLKQGMGRLIRTRQDRGVIALLDRRISTRSYGRLISESLPPCRRTRDLDEVVRFFGEMNL